jgi:hypothetical protein
VPIVRNIKPILAVLPSHTRPAGGVIIGIQVQLIHSTLAKQVVDCRCHRIAIDVARECVFPFVSKNPIFSRTADNGIVTRSSDEEIGCRAAMNRIVSAATKNRSADTWWKVL